MPTPSRPAFTYPALKYGPTEVYGACESDDCASGARTTCPECSGHFCLAHRSHDTHANAAPEDKAAELPD